MIFTTALCINHRPYLLQERNRLRSNHKILGETLPGIAIVVIQQSNTNSVIAVVFEQVTDQCQVAQRLAHLFAILVYHPGMHPDTRERQFLRKVFRLRNLTGVVRKGEVRSSAVYIDLRTEVAHRHRAALDMPARATSAPWAGPGRFAGSLCLPQHEIKWISLSSVVRKVPALVSNGQHGMIIVESNSPRHDAKFRVMLDTEKDTASALVRVAPRQ